MQEFGLHNIEVRVSDKVNFINPHGDRDNYKELSNSLVKSNKWDRVLSDKEQEDIIKLFMNRGLSRKEVEVFIKSKSKIRNYFMNNIDSAFALKTLGLLISYGIK
jgi:hypothetical protein